MQSQVTVVPKAVDLDLLRSAFDANINAPADVRSPAADLFGLLQVREPFPTAAELLHVHHRLRC
jgi:hypothetical protein